MTEATVQAALVRVTQLTHDVREFCFRPQSPLHFRAGQYVDLIIQPPSADTPELTRAYSICSAPEECAEFKIVANHVPGGKGTAFLFGLAPGVSVTMSGPRGHFVVDERGRRDYLFIATGTGIAPLLSMIRHLAAIRTERRLTLYWGLRSQRDLYYQTELDDLAKGHPNFSFVQTLSQPQAGWNGESGRVTALLDRAVQSVANVDAYVCGQQTMIDDVKMVLRKKGLCPVHTEKFY